VSEAK